MKPIEKNEFSSSVYGVKLYRDDIELIISKIESKSNFNISDEDNIYQNVEELIKYKGYNPKIIKLASTENFNYIFIRITDNIASITCRGEAFLRDAYEIEKLFLKRKKNPIITYFFNQRNAKFNLLILTIIISIYYSYQLLYLKQKFEYKNNFIGIGFWLIVLLITLLNQNFNEKIELKRKHESSFWNKNKDAILVAILSAIFGGIITYIIQK